MRRILTENQKVDNIQKFLPFIIGGRKRWSKICCVNYNYFNYVLGEADKLSFLSSIKYQASSIICNTKIVCFLSHINPIKKNMVTIKIICLTIGFTVTINRKIV